MAEYRLRIAGIPIALELPNAAWLPQLETRFGKFRDAAAPVLALNVSLCTDVAASPGGDPRVEEDAAGLHLRHDQFDALVPPEGAVRLVIHQAGETPEDPTYLMVLDSLLRIAVAERLAVEGGLLMHAAGVATGPDAGYVFFGPSGAGKTTVCKVSAARHRILCDEIIAVRPGPDGYRLYGTPFHGAWGDSLAEDVPLRELFYLAKAPHTRRAPLDRVSAMRALMESSVTYARRPEAVSRLMDVLLALSAAVPVTRLEFEPKESLWEIIEAPRP